MEISKEQLDNFCRTIVRASNLCAKHQQDCLQYQEDICRTIACGCHASTPHLLKTIIVEESDESE
jgi:hypothetical protein